MNKTLILLLILGPLKIAGQQSYSLQYLTELVLLENYQIRIVRNKQQMAENLNTPGNAGMLPTVGIASENSWDIQTSESRLYTGVTRIGDNAQSSRMNVVAELDWKVFDGLAMFARRDRLGYLANLGEINTKYYVEQTVADMAKAYYQLVREQQILDSYRQMQEVSRFRLEVETRKRDIGSGNALLYNQAILDFNSDSTMLLEQELRIREQQIQINRFINRAPELPLDPADKTIETKGIGSVQELTDLAVSSNRDLERARIEELLADADIRIERGNRYPHVSLFSNYALSYMTSETGIIESAQSRGAQFGVRVRFNLYDGGKQNIRVNNAILEQESSQIYTADVRAWLDSDFTRLTERYRSLEKQHQLLLQSVEAAEISLKIAREQLQSGAINGYEFRQTQLTSVKVQMQLTDLLFAMKVIETDVDRITGVLTEKLFSSF